MHILQYFNACRIFKKVPKIIAKASESGLLAVSIIDHHHYCNAIVFTISYTWHQTINISSQKWWQNLFMQRAGGFTSYRLIICFEISGENLFALQKFAHAIYRDIFLAVKIENFIGKILMFLIFLLKTLWVHIRTASLRRF